jgi:hypothetical protein
MNGNQRWYGTLCVAFVFALELGILSPQALQLHLHIGSFIVSLLRFPTYNSFCEQGLNDAVDSIYLSPLEVVRRK